MAGNLFTFNYRSTNPKKSQNEDLATDVQSSTRANVHSPPPTSSLKRLSPTLLSEGSPSTVKTSKTEATKSPLKISFTLIEEDFPAQQTLQLRPYQVDLAKEAISGKNVLIVSPTNSGKTHIAMFIAQSHLYANPKHRILFVVERIPLAEQQYLQFATYFKKNQVERVYGGSTEISVSRIVQDKAVVIITAGCLKNALHPEAKEPLSLESVSLIIFDEVHHALKDHPYNSVLDSVHTLAKEHPELRQPQIIGLTASPGTDQAENLEEAFSHLQTLCGNLLCSTIAFKDEKEVRAYMDTHPELQSVVIEAKTRTLNLLGRKLENIMRGCEDLLRQLFDINAFKVGANTNEAQRLITPPSNWPRNSERYTNFVGGLQKLLDFIPQENTEARILNELIRNFLDILHRALKVSLLFRDQDVITFLRNVWPTEREVLHEIGADVGNQLRTILDNPPPNEENPCLKQLKLQILEQLKRDPASRILVFVEERDYTALMVQVCQADVHLKSISVAAIVGAAASKCDGLLKKPLSDDEDDDLPIPTIANTLSEQRSVLKAFRNGECRVLFSTSVLKEGIDVVACNAVIRYVNVTNEIDMVQTRGRARAPNSRDILIYHEMKAWMGNKENVSKRRHELMLQAVAVFLKRGEDVMKPAIQQRIRLRDAQREARRIQEEQKLSSRRLKDGEFRMFCRTCTALITSSSFINKRSCHYFCLDPDLMKRCSVTTFTTPQKFSDFVMLGQLFCLQCKSKVGTKCRYMELPYFTVSVKDMSLCPVLPNGSSGNSITCKKWAEVPFSVPELSLEDFLDHQMDG